MFVPINSADKVFSLSGELIILILPITCVIISGIDVPIESIVNPTNVPETLKWSAKFKDDLTITSAKIRINTIPTSKVIISSNNKTK